MRGKYTNMMMGEKGGKLTFTALGNEVVIGANRISKTSNQQVRTNSINNAQMLHANTDINMIMSQNMEPMRRGARAASGQKRYIPKATDSIGARKSFNMEGSKRLQLDAEGAQLRKNLAQLNQRKARPIDMKEDAKLRQQAKIMLEETKKPQTTKDTYKSGKDFQRPQPGLTSGQKPPSSQQAKRSQQQQTSTAQPPTMKAPIEKVLSNQK